MMFAMVLGVVDDKHVLKLLGHVVDEHTLLVLVTVVVDELDRL